MNNNDYLEQLFNLPRFNNLLTPENNVRDLYNLIKKYLSTDTVMLEIGSFKGVSSELFAIHVKHIYCVDPYQEYPEMGSEIKNAENQFNIMLSKYNNITKIKKTSKEASMSDLFPDSSLDFVYVDGAHDYDSVYEDIKLWLPKIKNNGYIGGHDIYNHNVMRAINDHGLEILETFKEQSWISPKLIK